MVRCVAYGCKKDARYGVLGGKARRCIDHRFEEDMNLNMKLCEHFSCMKQPSFAPEGTVGALRCKTHSLPDDVNVKNKRCEYDSCNKVPSFGPIGGRRRTCRDHALPDYVCIGSKNCERCPRYAGFGQLGGAAVRCKTHSLPGDVCVRGTRCEESSCNKQAVFATEGSKRGLRCKTHSLPGDIDVTNHRCCYHDCRVRAHYGVFSLLPTYCSRHRDHKRHVRHPRARCQHWDDSGKCREYASHASYGQRNKRIYCGTHASPEMVDYSGECYSSVVTSDEDETSEE